MRNIKKIMAIILAVIILCGCFTSCYSKTSESKSVTMLVSIDDIEILKNGKEHNKLVDSENLNLTYDRNTDCVFLKSSIRYTTYSHYFTKDGSIYHYDQLVDEGITSVNFITIEDLYVGSGVNSVNLIYDERTKVVYMRNVSGMHVSYVAYPASNGLPYRYIDGKLVEIEL